MTDAQEDLLTTRPKTHGPFHEVARICHETKKLWKSNEGWSRLSVVQSEALEQIAHKVARILAGDPKIKEHWDDGSGYFRLGAGAGTATPQKEPVTISTIAAAHAPSSHDDDTFTREDNPSSIKTPTGVDIKGSLRTNKLTDHERTADKRTHRKPAEKI